jgi:hypothetical protein
LRLISAKIASDPRLQVGDSDLNTAVPAYFVEHLRPR